MEPGRVEPPFQPPGASARVPSRRPPTRGAPRGGFINCKRIAVVFIQTFLRAPTGLQSLRICNCKTYCFMLY